MHRLGDFELHALNDGFFRLDGGAMFGIVPRTLWEKVAPPDGQNRILLAVNTLLIRTGRNNVLVDAGIGGKFDADFAATFGIVRKRTLLDNLKGIGLGAEDIDTVILSHLHFDHAGGATVRSGEGFAPAFPRATIVLQEGMLEEARRPNPRTRRSYIPEDFLPLKEAGRIRFTKGDAEIVPGVSVRRTGGHVENHQVVVAESGGRTAVYWGDLLPTANHLNPAWVTGYDLFPHEVAAFKEEMVARSAAGSWVNFLDHDPQTAMAVFRKDAKGYKADPIERVDAPR